MKKTYTPKFKWRLESESGLVAGLDSRVKCCLVQPESPLAMTFDDRDNPDIKKPFYELMLGCELAAVRL